MIDRYKRTEHRTPMPNSLREAKGASKRGSNAAPRMYKGSYMPKSQLEAKFSSITKKMNIDLDFNVEKYNAKNLTQKKQKKQKLTGSFKPYFRFEFYCPKKTAVYERSNDLKKKIEERIASGIEKAAEKTATKTKNEKTNKSYKNALIGEKKLNVRAKPFTPMKNKKLNVQAKAYEPKLNSPVKSFHRKPELEKLLKEKIISLEKCRFERKPATVKTVKRVPFFGLESEKALFKKIEEDMDHVEYTDYCIKGVMYSLNDFEIEYAEGLLKNFILGKKTSKSDKKTIKMTAEIDMDFFDFLVKIGYYGK